MPSLLAGSPTLEQRMRTVGGPTRGFDYLRLVLAFGVIVWHSVLVCYGLDYLVAFRSSAFVRPLHNFILPMFFALSGFLVGGSLLRTTLPQFVSLRVLRIVPALAVEVLLSAFILGPVVTSRPLAEYFGSPKFHRYFLNLIGDIHYSLPGVFLTNPFPDNVNSQLWTIPVELQCYASLVLLTLLGIARKRSRMLIVTLVGIAALALVAWTIRPEDPGTLVSSRALVASFFAGVATYFFKDKIPFSGRLAAISAVAGALLMATPSGIYAAVIPLTYLTVYFGLTHPPKIPVLSSGDYSYGLYLFSIPIQQVVASYPETRQWWINILISLPVALLYATFSWHVVEKPIVAQKKRVLALIDGVALRVGLGVAANGPGPTGPSA